jgi:hypothetical protein
MSELKVNKVTPRSGTTVTLGDSGDTITIPSGATIDLSNATQTGVGGTNTPAFEATMSSTQTLSHNTATKAQFNSERFDTDSAYDPTTNYRFTVPTGKDGKYFIYSNVVLRGTNNRDIYIFHTIRKNGVSDAIKITISDEVSSATDIGSNISGVLSLVATDYVEINLEIYDYTASGTMTLLSGNQATFGGFKLIE